MTELPGFLTYRGIPVWRHIQVINWVSQVTSGVLVVTLVIWFFTNIGNAIQDREIPHGFSFLSRAYQTPIGQHFIPYESSDTFLYAFGVAATNTLIVSIAGVILATALGIVVGVVRLSGNWIVSKLALVYIEFFRNVPLLVQLFFWFYLVLALPPVRQGYVIWERLYINNAGFSLPFPAASDTYGALTWMALAAGAAAAGLLVRRLLSGRETRTGAISYPLASGIATTVVLAAVAWIAVGAAFGGSPLYVSWPAPQGTFGRISGGLTLSGGLIALLAGLVIYTSSFVAEIVRAGLQSVNRGQSEAARGAGPFPDGCPASGHLPPGAPGHSAAADQPMPQPDQEQQPGWRHRLLGPDQRGQDDDADRAGSVHIHPDYGGLPGAEPDLLANRQPVQPAHPHNGG